MRSRLFGFLVLALFSTINAQLSTALADPGDLDTTFAGTGESRIGFGGGYGAGKAAAVQSDGKLVLAGYSGTGYATGEFVLVRFGTNNAPDLAFGGEGKVATPVGAVNYAGATAVGIQSDGKIVAAGYAYNGSLNLDFALVRYNPDGSLDSSFGSGGKVITTFGVDAAIYAMTIQSDGKIVVAGGIVALPLRWRGTRPTARSTLRSEAAELSSRESTMPNLPRANGVMIESDGNIVAVGYAYYSEAYFAVFRYTTNGVLDTTFGGGSGEVLTLIGDGAIATAAATQFGNGSVQNPDRIVVAGSDYNSGFFVVARYNLDGSLDTSFGNGGVVTNSFGGSGSNGQALRVQGTGLIQPRKITVAGYGSDGLTGYFAMARLTATGALDTTFGGGTGIVTLSFGAGGDDEAYAMTFEGSQIVLGGLTTLGNGVLNFAAARFNSDGSLDTTFGNGGVVTADTDLDCHAQSVAIQSDGKVVVVGGAYDGFALARYNPDGSLDAAFGSIGGRVTTAVGASDAVANAVQLQPDGKIVAAGFSYNGANQYFALARYTTNGTLDTAFGSAGNVTTAVGSSNDLANAVALQTDGKIVVAGESFNGANNVFAVVRYATNGVLDSSFGGTGKVTTTIGSSNAVAEAVQVQPDAKIVAAGYTQIGNNADFVLARYNPDGSLDNSFGSSGIVTTDFGGGRPAFGYEMTIQPDGRIIAAGSVVIDGNTYIALARYGTNGVLDTSFGTGGKVTMQVGQYATSLALQPDGKILVAGVANIGGNDQYVVLRCEADGSLDAAYGIGGEVVVSFGDAGNDLGLQLRWIKSVVQSSWATPTICLVWQDCWGICCPKSL